MNGEDEKPYSYDLSALTDYDPNQYQQRTPTKVGVEGVLHTPSGPSSPSVLGPTIGIRTNTNPSPPCSITVGVGGQRPTVG